jgi:thioredoxin 1
VVLLDEIAGEHGEALRIVTLDVDENVQTAQRHQPPSLPTMMVFVNGEVDKSIVGGRSKAELPNDPSSLYLMCA